MTRDELLTAVIIIHAFVDVGQTVLLEPSGLSSYPTNLVIRFGPESSTTVIRVQSPSGSVPYEYRMNLALLREDENSRST
ncbi:hypothetical protein PM082_006459 [Marasmius tenuissimus]|nr:hypothetical protein PM082_006459 [Marasmius tenuissimus]